MVSLKCNRIVTQEGEHDKGLLSSHYCYCRFTPLLALLCHFLLSTSAYHRLMLYVLQKIICVDYSVYLSNLKDYKCFK
jgi:hypothetical protein